jgi:hypothetical protein
MVIHNSLGGSNPGVVFVDFEGVGEQDCAAMKLTPFSPQLFGSWLECLK